MISSLRTSLPPLALLQPANEDVYLLDGLEIPITLRYLAPLSENPASLGVFVQLVERPSQRPVRHRVVGLALDGSVQILSGFLIFLFFKQLVAQGIEDHRVVWLPFEELTEHLGPRSFHNSPPEIQRRSLRAFLARMWFAVRLTDGRGTSAQRAIAVPRSGTLPETHRAPINA